MCKVNQKKEKNRTAEISTRFSYSGRGEHTIRIGFDDYKNTVLDHTLFRAYLSAYYSKYPEVFPVEFNDKYRFHDIRISKKEPHFIWLKALI